MSNQDKENDLQAAFADPHHEIHSVLRGEQHRVKIGETVYTTADLVNGKASQPQPKQA